MKNFLAVALGGVFAIGGMVIGNWVKPPAKGETKKVVGVLSYQEKSDIPDWWLGSTSIYGSSSFRRYWILTASDGSHVRVDGKPPVMVDHGYTSAEWSRKQPTP